MSEPIPFLTCAVLIGAGATAFMDVFAAAREKLFGTASLNYALVGRWLAYLPRGRFFHTPITASPPVQGERLIGWTAHYATGIAFATLLLAITGLDWVRQPTVAPALMVGIGSVVASFLLMQPGMGFGIAASSTPNPSAARLRSLTTHAVFGLGLYAAGWTTNLLAVTGFIAI
jgi:hypothetical protein